MFLEAMACDKPVVANDRPVQRWIIGDAGLLCNCLDPQEYAFTLRNALNADFGDVPRKRATEFDWNHIARRYDRVIQDAIS